VNKSPVGPLPSLARCECNMQPPGKWRSLCPGAHYIINHGSFSFVQSIDDFVELEKSVDDSIRSTDAVSSSSSSSSSSSASSSFHCCLLSVGLMWNVGGLNCFSDDNQPP